MFKLDKDVVCITYNSPSHKRFQQNFQDLYTNKFYKYIAYDMEFIKNTKFYEEHLDLFSYEKYFGYFLWKPYLIDLTLGKYPDKIVLYCDSNLRFFDLKRFEQILSNTLEYNQFFFIKHFIHQNKTWTKRDTFILMNLDSHKYHVANQVWTVCMAFKDTPISRDFVKEYLNYCSQEQIVTDSPSILGKELPEFVEHRWEQSVLSLLVEKYNISGIWDTDIYSILNKVYDQELMEFKNIVNKNPLKRNYR